MNNYEPVLNLLLILTLIVGGWYIVHTMEKHSVHPIYGNYKKLDSEMKKCEPWQACK